MKSELVPQNGDPPIRIVKDVTIVGRGDDCDIMIDHPGLSQRHCVLVRTDGLVVVRDLISTNGTKVNGQRIRWAALLPNDRLSFGGYKARLYLGSDVAPSPSESAFGRSATALPRPEPAPPPAGRASPVIELGDEDLEFLED